MPGLIQQAGASVICPHGGQVQEIPAGSAVLLSGQPAMTQDDEYLVAGCPFNVAGVPQPCVEVVWMTPATRILINGVPAVLADSTGLCLSAEQAPQGPPNVVATQTRVTGT
ncbi:MAG: hypothetical protein OK456_01185 [Thaumarchaeota archaeon]|nr:hypothetical protein [Nitrososphaerota archaeon]